MNSVILCILHYISSYVHLYDKTHCIIKYVFFSFVKKKKKSIDLNIDL